MYDVIRVITTTSLIYYSETIEQVELSDKNINVLSDKIIGVYDIELPMLKVGDKIYLSDIDEVVIIKDKMRNSNNTITYYAEDKEIETNRTIESKIKAEEKITDWSALKKENEMLLQYKNTHPYRHRFINIKCD